MSPALKHETLRRSDRRRKDRRAARRPQHISRHVEPSFIVDIRTFSIEKLAAIKAHSSQFYDPNSSEPETRLTSKNFLYELENRSRYFGSLIGVAAGEPFYVREALNIHDPVDLLTRSMNLYS